ncbi:hypothetical protein ACFOWB_13630 [Chenggangzhangella methanolivorans]|uniref:hypothetical protein n=1 Tax=Chenggangzhangella methanolivorans TaxID=1437009 RepID=UPI0036090311
MPKAATTFLLSTVGTAAMLALCCAGGAAAADFPTTPKALTAPAAGTSDSKISAVGTSSGLVVAWNRSSGTSATILIQRFKDDGSAVGQPLQLDGPGFVEGLPTLVDLGRGKVGVVWKGPNASFSPSLKGAVYDVATGKIGAITPVLASGAASYIHDLALLKNGKVAVVTRSFATGGEDTTLIKLDGAMKPVGASRVVEDDVSGPFGAASYEQTVVANGSGGVAIFRASDSQLKGVPFDGAGKPGKQFQINSTTMPALDFFAFARFTVKAQPISNGGYVVTWVAYDAGQQLRFDVYARVFDSKGKAVGKDFVVHRDVSGDQAEPEIVAFDKGFGIGWHNVQVVGGFATQRMRFFDPAGKPLSEDLVTERFGIDGPSEIAIPNNNTEHAVLPNGDFLKLFAANGGIWGDRIAALAVGTPKGDKLAAKAAAATLLAREGSDEVKGGDGDDLIDGGEDDDVIVAGAGADQIAPGGGNDTITGGPGADVFIFAPKGGKDTILDFQSIDRVDASAFHYNGREDVVAAAKQVGKDVVITLVDQTDPKGASATVRLKKYKLENFTSANVIQ